MASRTVVIITAYHNTTFQREMLDACVNSIKEHMNYVTIVILDDDHSLSSMLTTNTPVWIEKTPHARCGEVNAYVWACAHRNEFDRFIFLHDSTILLKDIPMDLPNHFRPFWYTSKYISDNLKGGGVEEFMDKFNVKGDLCHDIYRQLLQNRGSIVFGGMAIFDRQFLDFVSQETNLLDLAHTLNTRFLRCFFERLLYIIYSKLGDSTQFNQSAICGDIFNHREAFQPARGIRKELANNPYVLKLWQGR